MTEADIPVWLKNLPLAPEYRPTETEFADPIAFISRIEREAASFGICKVIPPVPKPSKKFVLSNLNRSLSKSPELGDAAAASAGPSSEAAVFTTRQQELGSRRGRPALPKQVWQSGDVYTLEQFEGKSKAFARSQLGGFKEVTPLLVESLFWKAVTDKPINIEYANDVPGSGFAVPEEPFRYISWRRNRKRGLHRGKVNEEKCGFRLMSSGDNGQPQKSLGSGSDVEGMKGTSGWKLSNSRWNLQVIARSPGSLTRFMPDDVPGVTSPMVYIGMLFSWFAWHVEDHELHSMNYLHMGSPKTWYAVPQDHAVTLEEMVRFHGYGESVDRLAAFIMLGEKTTLLSPEVLVASGVPCCRLVQHPGEFVVTFPRAYHVGFSHGFNCGEAANFATPEWLKVAKEAAIRRAAMNHLPMLSHQQLLYILTMSFVSRIPRTLISGVRSSRLRDRKKEEREILVKKAFLTDMMNENYLLCVLLEKESTSPILWEPYMLPAPCVVSQSYPSISLKSQYFGDQNGCCTHNQQMEINTQGESLDKVDDCHVEKPIDEAIALRNTCSVIPLTEQSYKNPIHADLATSDLEAFEDEDDLPVGLNVDSGSLACVACGNLGYPFMAVIQPSVEAAKMIFSIICEESHEKSDKSQCFISSPCLQNDACNSTAEERCPEVAEQANLHASCQLCPKSSITSQHSREHDMLKPIGSGSFLNYFPMNSLENKGEKLDATECQTKSNKCVSDSSANAFCSHGIRSCESVKKMEGIWRLKTSKTVENGPGSDSWPFSEDESVKEKVSVPKWDVSNILLRPRVFCLQHAIEVEELLHNRGGVHIRVICHSDYLKFKAYAASIAEEMRTELQLKDVPLENASQEDLNLINISIDDEEHQEDGKDWTSKLGVNLRYYVKFRKHSASTQEQLPSALSGMFSSSSTVSILSSLRWLRRKSRTPAKPQCIIAEKPHISATATGGVQTLKVIDGDNIKAIQVYQSRKKKTSDLAFKDHKHPVKELGSCNQNVAVIGKSEYVAAPVIDNVENLFTVPISMMENPEISQNSIAKSSSPSVGFQCFSGLNGLNNTTIVSVPVIFQYNQLYYNTPTSNSSVLYNEEKNGGETSLDSDGGRSKKLELQDEMAIPELKSSEDKQLIVTGSEANFHDSGNLSSEHLLLSSDEEAQHMQEKTQTTEEQNAEGSPRFSLLAENHSYVPQLLTVESEMHIEASMAEELRSSNCSVHCEEELCSVIENEDEMQKIEASTGNNNCSPDVFVARDERRASTLNIKSYVRRKNKRKWDAERQGAEEHMETENTQKKLEIQDKEAAQQTCNGFIRSPCEGLRPRNGKLQSYVTEVKVADRRRGSNSMGRRKRAAAETSDTFECDIEGCRMRFRTKAEIQLHKRNRCTYDECRKRFSNHKYAMRHQRVHNDERPFKCSWKGCKMSFKWEWARTEHLRLHTGERPYKCKVAGCGMSFRFVSDFSRHRRKTGHFVSTNRP
ncbi:lysine-specific demethylase REF6 isoform X1 [Dendrobium catenatum]|uniref:Putative lysine-specific demethylase ELF6 n=1 Tax=Dendrobium catenatum TaxID=906689 RepID=A0A2I0VVB7_9ASPA|nr:lysine-specific demethylase REF6 isoform X1 [Dendrobium catenatum]PKU67351.1 putative lysine-specific demethylase ELF6 [Dendrobium catenatum]